MDDSDDEKLKAEIDKIMSNVAETMKRIEELNLIGSDDPGQHKD